MSSAKSKFKKILITGIILILPLAVSIYIVLLIFRKVDGIFSPIIDKILGYHIPGLGFILTFILIWAVGIIGTNFIGRRLFNKFDKFMLKVPLVRIIYGTTKQLIDAFKFKSIPFKQAVLIEYPRRGIWAIGFVASNLEGELQKITPTKLVSVFYVTTPNPTSGFLVFVPEKDVVPLHMQVEDALKLVVSGGVFTPEYPPPGTPVKIE